MNNNLIKHISFFIGIVLVQALLLNNLNLFDYLNPYVYILFILLFPVHLNKSLFIFICFLLGLSIDMFSNSGGIHAAACLVIGYIRPFVLKFSFGTSYEFHQLKIATSDFGARIVYFTILIFIHHLILFFLEYFSFNEALKIIKLSIITTLFSLFLIILSMSLFSKNSR